MVEGDESSRLRVANEPGVLAGYRPLLMALQTSQNSCDPSLYFISFLCLKSKTGLPPEEVNISLKIEAYVRM